MGAQPSQVLPGLWIGGQEVLHDQAWFQKTGVGYVLSFGQLVPHASIQLSGREQVNLPDLPTADLSKHFRRIVQFIATGRHIHSRGVFVHGSSGVSRSVAAVCAYLLAHLGLPLQQVLAYLAKMRSKAHPNDGFVQQLKRFEASEERATLEMELKKLGPGYLESRQRDLDEVRKVLAPPAAERPPLKSKAALSGAAALAAAAARSPAYLLGEQARTSSLRFLRELRTREASPRPGAAQPGHLPPEMRPAWGFPDGGHGFATPRSRPSTPTRGRPSSARMWSAPVQQPAVTSRSRPGTPRGRNEGEAQSPDSWAQCQTQQVDMTSGWVPGMKPGMADGHFSQPTTTTASESGWQSSAVQTPDASSRGGSGPDWRTQRPTASARGREGAELSSSAQLDWQAAVAAAFAGADGTGAAPPPAPPAAACGSTASAGAASGLNGWGDSALGGPTAKQKALQNSWRGGAPQGGPGAGAMAVPDSWRTNGQATMQPTPMPDAWRAGSAQQWAPQRAGQAPPMPATPDGWNPVAAVPDWRMGSPAPAAARGRSPTPGAAGPVGWRDPTPPGARTAGARGGMPDGWRGPLMGQASMPDGWYAGATGMQMASARPPW